MKNLSHDQINDKINKIRKIEDKARELQLKLNLLKSKWENEMEQVRGSGEWKNSCHENGRAETYEFYDTWA